MSTKNAIGAVAVAALLVLAGCSSAVPGSTTQVQSTTAGSVDGGGSSTADAADLTFYVSDRPGAIEDFEHLNVTITKIGLHKTGDAAEDGDDGDDADAEDTTAANDTTTSASATDTTASDGNAALDSVETTTAEEPSETSVDMTETETETEDDESDGTEETETESEDDESEDGDESEEPETEDDESEDDEAEDDEAEDDEAEDDEAEDDDAEADSEDDESEADGWVTHDVDNETVDLTKLQGANATAISNVSVPAGEYDKVFVYVSDVNATLTNGESVNVKLPSSKLQLTKPFTVSANSSPDFVFDINVHKAGNSGKYILRPIVSESGTGDQVEIEKVDKNGKPENPGNSAAKGNDDDESDDDESEDEDDAETEDDESEDDARDLEATLEGAVRAGETVTLSVTDANGSVANATVEVNGETVGETGADGTLAFEVPDTEELEVEVTAGDAEVELERKIKGGNGNGNGNGGGNDLAQPLSGYALAAV
jgi:hypothetical protein